FATFNASPVTVAGTTGVNTVSIDCNNVSAVVGAGSFSASVPLKEGNNTLTCVARDGGNQVGTASVTVTLDTTPPRVSIDCPRDGATVTSATLTVAGIVNDVVVGTVNGEQATVVCNGIAAAVANRTFAAPAVPLAEGPNVIRCTATDR